MTWFEALTGVREVSPDQVRDNLVVEGEWLISRSNGRSLRIGRLETPSLADLRQRVGQADPAAGRLTARQVVANVSALHADEANAGCVFQVASQFNLLEMVGPQVTPEQGVGIYEHDFTQGPACAIAAGAGTIYRNYFAVVNGRVGQSADNQIDCLADMGKALGNTAGRLWEMKNGYALASQAGLSEIAQRLDTASEAERDALRQRLRIGIQWNTQVTLGTARHTVTQVYCSALPVAYSPHPAGLWEGFARLVLEAAYEATLCVAVLNARAGGAGRVFLTLLGGGAFGNRMPWILGAIQRALQRYQAWNLEVILVSYSVPNRGVQRLLAAWAVSRQTAWEL